MTRLVIRGGEVFDSIGGGASVADVAIEGDRIVDVGTGLDGDEAIDASGHAVYPGFIDSHVHFMADGDLDPMAACARRSRSTSTSPPTAWLRTLATGITTCREAGGSDLGVKQAQTSGLVPGPHMQISIAILSQTGGHGDGWQVCGAHLPGIIGGPHPGKPHNIVDGPEEMRKKVRELFRAGADVIKVVHQRRCALARDDPRHGHFRDAELDVLVAEAAAAGKWVMAHAQATEGIKSAVRAGIRSIEHGIYLDDEAISMMLDRGTYLVPTLIAPIGVLEAADRGVNVPQYAIDKTRMVIDVHRRASAGRWAGVKVAMGTDSGVTPHGQNLRELEEMVSCGMSPAEALIAATHTAAALLGVDEDRGVIDVGKRADVVIAAGEALDINGLGQRIRTVIQDGKVVVEHKH